MLSRVGCPIEWTVITYLKVAPGRKCAGLRCGGTYGTFTSARSAI